MLPVDSVIFQTLICVLRLLRLVAKHLTNGEALPDCVQKLFTVGFWLSWLLGEVRQNLGAYKAHRKANIADSFPL